MTVKQTHREFDRIVKEYGKTAQLISEEERREIRQHEIKIKMKEIDRDIEVAREANRSKEIDRDIEVAREANRSKELDIELRKLQMGDEHRPPRGFHTVPGSQPCERGSSSCTVHYN
ncbi:hypothetical protein CVIRNUC_003570 [Coccomyxa viridis]|uniref:Uncharacterized protein n=1 Tax=Coccomyxa viridis TaxID=1274662 RepID=A0AAV1I2R3_9CHLO|nr:hypothetical protein CVIRNUC_003570 [Coccomyxa viridis]